MVGKEKTQQPYGEEARKEQSEIWSIVNSLSLDKVSFHGTKPLIALFMQKL